MKKISNIILVAFCLTLGACEDFVEGLNDNPNAIDPEELIPEQYLTGIILANNVTQAGHLSRIAGILTGQLEGYENVYGGIQDYVVSSAESDATWTATYVGVVTNVRYILERTAVEPDPLLSGIVKVIEAHAVGTLASMMGDIPYSEINNESFQNPAFDDQADVLQALIARLDDGISDLNSATTRNIPADYYYEGDKVKWIKAANTLKARYYLLLKQYANAFTAASSGIDDASVSMIFAPDADIDTNLGDANLFWQLLEARGGDIGNKGAYLLQLLDPSNASSRNNSKTDETARLAYYTIDEKLGTSNDGIIEQNEPHELVTYQENQLILAECAARTSGLAAGLTELNKLRVWLAGGGRLNTNYSGMSYRYDPYVAADFAAGGIENIDGSLSGVNALLREIIEERYVSGFGSFLPMQDATRLRKSEKSISVLYPLNTGTVYPERLPISNEEVNANENSPIEALGIFVVLPINE